MAAPSISLADQLSQLDKARKLVLGDAAYYPDIVPGILPLVGASARVELRRWGADFLAETFASPLLASEVKESLSIQVLDTLQTAVQTANEDTDVLKSVIQTAASIFPLVFRHIVSHADDAPSWEKMSMIKSNILKMWDNAAVGIRVCCVKFVQRVVQSQTPGVIADPRRPDPMEISLAIVPRDHPLIPPPHLEAEASGLLDRLLNVFLEETSDALIVNATLNSLSPLIRTRPAAASKIITAILNFNPLKQASPSMSPKTRVAVKSMERTTRALLVNTNKQNPSGPMAGRIQQYLERLVRSRIEALAEGNRKRPAPGDGNDVVDAAKRARLGASSPATAAPRVTVPELPAGPLTVAQLFTLTADEALSTFDVQQLPIEMLVKITPPVLQRLDQGLLDEAIAAIRARWDARSSSGTSYSGVSGVDDEDEDYEPDFPAEDDEQIMNKLDDEGTTSRRPTGLRPFQLPPPARLGEDEVDRLGHGMVARIFSAMSLLEPASALKPSRAGFSRLAGSGYDREAWVTLLTRLASRSTVGLDASEETAANGDRGGAECQVSLRPKRRSLGQAIRESLYRHVVEDFRHRINTAIAWLNEEWYNDRIQGESAMAAPAQYELWVIKVLDGMLPYLDAKDKVFTRFLSEIPQVDAAVLERVKGLARDPERVPLAVNTLHYLVLLRPPVRELALDALQDLWENYDDARLSAAKVLNKWRPNLAAAEVKPMLAQVDEPGAMPASAVVTANGVSATSRRA